MNIREHGEFGEGATVIARSKRVVRNSVRLGLFDVSPGTVGRVTKDCSDKVAVTWSDGSWGLYKKDCLTYE